MLREFRSVRQETGGFRRLFSDEYADLWLWYRRRWGRLLGFQLCYDKRHAGRVLTWTRREGYRHDAVDEGDSSGGHRRSPMLVPGGAFDAGDLAARFLDASSLVPRRIRRFVHRTLLGSEPIDVRIAHPAEAELIAELNAEFNGVRLGADAVAGALAGGSEIVALACAGTRALGFGCAQLTRSCCYDRPTGEITELYVRSAHRRKGIGSFLLSLLERELVTRGAKEIRVLTGATNRAALELYGANGYRRKNWAALAKEV